MRYNTDMHHIQRKILNLLVYAHSLTYAQLRPKGVESNHFAYHLEQLIKAGYIKKLERGYELTPEGLAFADRASHADMNVRKQAHIVTTMVITNAKGQTLLFKHAFQPYLGKVGYPQGRTHFEEDIITSAKRELQEKSGLSTVDVAHRGLAYITTHKNGEIVSKILSHVFSGTVEDLPDVASGDELKGSAFWGDLRSYSQDEYMPGVFRIQELLSNTEPEQLFFDEIHAELH